jgi:CBS domain-containing protein
VESFAAAADLHTRQVIRLIRGAPLTCTSDAKVTTVAQSMEGGTTRAVVVLGSNGEVIGIVTDRDLRAKVVARGRDPSVTTAGAVMSSPVFTVPVTARAIEALLEMTHREIHHLPVIDRGKLCGVISSDDLVMLSAADPVRLAQAFRSAASIPALAELATRIIDLVRSLVERGTRAHDIGSVVAELNDRLVRRVLVLSEATVVTRRAAAAPAPYSWLLFGSEARREQTLRTDQDNGLVYGDDAGDGARAWFQELARETIDGLLAVGFPPCPGGAMASNPEWCQPLSVWTSYFRTWMAEPTPQHLLAASMYFDVRPLSGELSLGARLAAVIHHDAPRHAHFLSALARDVVDRPLPRSLLGGIKVPRRGAARGTVDVKAAGGIHLVAAGRIHALALGLPETSTVDRFLGASAAGIYTPAKATEITDAFEHLLRLRLLTQLEALLGGVPPGNRVNLGRLSRRDALLLRVAFDTTAGVQHDLRERFHTDLMM